MYGKYTDNLDSGLKKVYKFCPAKRMIHLKEVAKNFKEVCRNVHCL
jgi:hypothetical protein